MQFPASAAVKKLDQEHPEYSFFKDTYQKIGLLYQGGTALAEAVIHSGLFLLQAPKEMPEVYAIRQLRFSYTNLLGNIIGWYTAALFKEPPQLTKKVDGVQGEAALAIPKPAAEFCTAFENDCDRAGTSLIDFMAEIAETCLLYRKAYICLDIPSPLSGDAPPLTLQQQKDGGLLNPFLVRYTPRDAINWETDAYGNLEWIEIKISIREQEFMGEPVVTDYWYFFDRQNVALYQRTVQAGGSSANLIGADAPAAEEMAQLVDGYPRRHATANQNTVPIRAVQLREGLWLANRVFLPLVNHLNQDNALDFGLFQSNLPQLVITDGENGRYEEPVTISPVGYHQLPFGAIMSFLEPEGKSFAVSQSRIDSLEERIYKACYLSDQARTNKATPAAQSGLSKQMDKMPSRDALSGVGKVVRAATQSVYTDVLAIAGFATIRPDIRGLDFSDKATADDMALIEQSTVIPVNSTLFEREIAKKNIRLALPDANTGTIDAIDAEIDDNPTPSEQRAQQQEAQRQASIQQFQASLQAAVPTEAQGQ
jgi:hypothetical protein